MNQIKTEIQESDISISSDFIVVQTGEQGIKNPSTSFVGHFPYPSTSSGNGEELQGTKFC